MSDDVNPFAVDDIEPPIEGYSLGLGRKVSKVAEDGTPLRVAYIRTSDRQSFKRCRRKWDWQYVHRGNRTSNTRSNPLWLGSGLHFALEDRHGARRYGTGSDAFRAYFQAWLHASKVGGISPPDDAKELCDLAYKMLDYYELWLENREELHTLMVDGKPQTEIRFEIELPIPKELLNLYGWDKCVSTGTIDRVIIDEYRRLWPLDYKSAKRFETGHFDTDPQISSYCWAAQQLYPTYEIAGFIYQQHKKQVPETPKFLSSSGMFSVSKTQATTRPLYRQSLLNLYGTLEKAPKANLDYLDHLMLTETDTQDRFIRRDFVSRNKSQISSVFEQMCLEAIDMLNPNLSIYPNHTRDCSWDCNFQQACVNRDDGGDWQFELENTTIDRNEEDAETWQRHLPAQEELQ